MRFSAAAVVERLLPHWLAERAAPFAARLDVLMRTADASGEAGRISLIAFGLRIANALIAFLSQVLLARYMGGFEYGIFVLVWVTVILLGNISCVGLHTSIIRFIPEYRAKQRFEELRGILFASRLFVLLSSTAVAAIGILGIWLFEPLIKSYYVLPFYLGLFCLPMIALGDQLQGIARANAWAWWALTPTYLVRPLLILLFVWILHLTGHNPDAKSAVIAAILATYLTSLAQLAGVAPQADRNMPAARRRYLWRDWMAVSLPIFLVESFFFLLTNADVLMVGWMMQPTDVAVYYATVKTLALVHFVYFAVKAGVAQRYAAYVHSSERSALERFARETVSWTFWPSLAMGLVVLVLGKPILMLFGPGFSEGYPLLFLLVAAVIGRAAVGPAESLLTMSGHENACAAVYAITLGINIGFNFLLIPVLGLWGAALATSIAMAFESTALFLTVWRKLGIAMVVFLPVPSGKEAL
ncbi:lipopolysaccharide biosynthesis protein [Chelativorans sp. Marseille-P2723]|uniref:lipopolysaccharide biosynthesis protein n=1 Tax=Chelativorans sp. Marseille-P2723 TaxID=2709133 RepID=UPI001FF01D38|nr:lipopolysaccharide biosynthesis protein [Chelativorans sp. Marseille-P2723]